MKNIQASEDPLKAEQRAVLQDHLITAKFLDDPMKFSHNAEWSWYNGESKNRTVSSRLLIELNSK